MRVRATLLMLALAGTLTLASPTLAQDAGSDADVREEILSKPGSPITFYGHLFGHGRGVPIPMNTQFPANEDDYSLGNFGGCGNLHGVPVWPLGPVGGTTPDPTQDDQGMDCIDDYTGNESWWYTTAGFVQVKNRDEWGGDYGKFHNERGQTKDIYFDTAQPIQATFWMSADAHAWSTAFCDLVVASACWNWDPGVYQDWVVAVTVYHANLGEWSSDPSAQPDMTLVTGGGANVTVVAYGASPPTDFVSMDSTVPVVGGQTVHGFPVEVQWDPAFDGVVPYDENLIVRFEWYQETNPGERYILTPGYVAGVAWNINAGEDYPPSIVFPVRNPMDVELVYPRFVHDKLVVLGIINTPWGSYDIDTERTKLVVRDAQGTVVPIKEDLLEFDLDSSVAHGGHYKPINATWVWGYQEQGLEPGAYTASVETINFQHSYSTSTTATFTIADDGTGTSTGAGRGGLASFSQDEFQDFTQGQATVTTATAPTDDGAGKDSPGLGLLGLVVAAAVALVRRRA